MIAVLAASTSARVGPRRARSAISASMAASSSAGVWPGLAVAVTVKTEPSVSESTSVDTDWAMRRSWTSRRVRRLARVPSSSWLVTMAS